MKIIDIFLVLMGSSLACIAILTFPGAYQQAYEQSIHTHNVTIDYKEVKNLRCAGVNAIGCTTVLSHKHHYLIEYVPQSQRLNRTGQVCDFCITINQTIAHELNHVDQDIKYGYMWEVD